ncbi:MAG TPA: hypothetical protein VE981_19625 [Planctomycetota bacterium]|nr:hypothetical protein [Planctomycetota bacterium]
MIDGDPVPRRVLLWWLAVAVILSSTALLTTLVPTQDCLSCRLHEQQTGTVERSFVLTTQGCVGMGWTGCPDCRGRTKVPLATYLRRKWSQG